jgi:septal ring factor EnvC (AmiA/AmiB activator)
MNIDSLIIDHLAEIDQEIAELRQRLATAHGKRQAIEALIARINDGLAAASQEEQEEIVHERNN